MALKVGLVGAGGIGRVHLDALAKVEEVQVTAVCDTDRSRAEEAAGRTGATAHINYRTLLERETLDALYVCLPPFAHADVEILAAQKGIHLFVEKPVSLSAERADQVAAEIAKAGIISSVGYTWRYFSAVDEALALVKDRAVAMVVGQWLGRMPGTPWWRQQEKSGGQLVEQVTHLFDLGRMFCGEADTVFAVGSRGIMARQVEGHTIDDADAVAVKFRAGAAGCFLSANMLPVNLGSSFRILADGAAIEITGRGVEIAEKGRKTTIEHQGDTYLAEARAFVEAVQKRDPSLVKSDYADAVRTLKVTLAALRSIETGKAVTL